MAMLDSSLPKKTPAKTYTMFNVKMLQFLSQTLNGDGLFDYKTG